MSFCYDCSDKGYDMCFCKPIKQPNIKFVSEIDTIKKLQSQLKQKDEEIKKAKKVIESLYNNRDLDEIDSEDLKLTVEWLEKHKEIK